MRDLAVSRRGEVHRGGTLIGYVDRYEPGRSNSRTWRWVLPGGTFSRERFTSRAQAVAALAAQG